MFTVCKNIPINQIKQITLILLTPFLVIIRRQLKVNYSNKGQEFPEITKVFRPVEAQAAQRVLLKGLTQAVIFPDASTVFILNRFAWGFNYII